MIILQVGAGLLACLIVAQFLVVLPNGISSIQMSAVIGSTIVLVWIGAKSCWLTVVASVGAAIGTVAFGHLLNQIITTLPSPVFDAQDAYKLALLIVGGTVCAASLYGRGKRA